MISKGFLRLFIEIIHISFAFFLFLLNFLDMEGKEDEIDEGKNKSEQDLFAKTSRSVLRDNKRDK